MQNRLVIAVFSASYGRGGGIKPHSMGVKLIKQFNGLNNQKKGEGCMFYSSSGVRLREYFYSVVSVRPEREKYAATIFQHSHVFMLAFLFT